MRIIGGTHRSRRLLSPEGDETTRPITDRVKQTLFDKLNSAGLVEEGNALDIFAGTGSLGLEALSRGSEHCTFVERDYTSRALLQENISLLRLSDEATVLQSDALTLGWLNTVSYKPFRMVFCDPPFPMTDEEEGLSGVMALIKLLTPHMEPGGALMMRTRKGVKPPLVEGWGEPLRQEYGSMLVNLYQIPLAESDSDHDDANEADQAEQVD